MTLGFDEIRLSKEPFGRLITLVFKGRLEKDDYKLFVPQLEKIIETGEKIRLLIELKDFKGWTAGAMWEDTKFGLMHFRNIERLAIVGQKQWEKTMAAFIKLFTHAKVRYFDVSELELAETWIRKADQNLSEH